MSGPATPGGAGRRGTFYPASLLAAIDAALAVDVAQRPQNGECHALGVLGRDEHAADATVVAPRRPVARGLVATGPVPTGPLPTGALPMQPQLRDTAVCGAGFGV